MFYSKVAAFLLALSPMTSSHGGSMFYVVDGVSYSDIQCDWTWYGISYLDDPGLACNNPGTPLNLSYHAPVTAGSNITVDYHTPDSDGIFGHPYGPMIAYMARCPDEGCEFANCTAKMWFKIWHAGFISGPWVGGYWAMRDVFEGGNLDIPTPSSLRPGRYLLKHDMVNLQTGPLQLFPNCVHLEVSGDGDALSEADDLVAFQGGYDADVGTGLPGPYGNYWLYIEHENDTGIPLPWAASMGKMNSPNLGARLGQDFWFRVGVFRFAYFVRFERDVALERHVRFS